MSNSEHQKPTAFVIMPFSEGFDEIYNGFLTETLREAGFEVSRAGEPLHSQNILKDITRGIKNSDLIVADLTDSNPNVLYELGLAHALNKPVILLTQNIEALPFDINSYRTIPYTRDFMKMGEARKSLKDLSIGLLSGEENFGSPVSDFLDQPVEVTFQHPTGGGDSGEAGILDHFANLEDDAERIEKYLISFGSKTEELNQVTRQTTERLESLKNKPDGRSARQERGLVMNLAQKLDGYAKFLSTENDQYTPILNRYRTSWEVILKDLKPHTPEEREQIKSLFNTLITAEGPVEESLSNIRHLTKAVHETPPVERTFNRAQKQAVKQLQRVEGNVEQFASMIARAKETLGEMLGGTN